MKVISLKDREKETLLKKAQVKHDCGQNLNFEEWLQTQPEPDPRQVPKWMKEEPGTIKFQANDFGGKADVIITMKGKHNKPIKFKIPRTWIKQLELMSKPFCLEEYRDFYIGTSFEKIFRACLVEGMKRIHEVIFYIPETKLRVVIE